GQRSTGEHGGASGDPRAGQPGAEHEAGNVPAVLVRRGRQQQHVQPAGGDGEGSVPRRRSGGGRTAYAGSTSSGGWINALGADYAWMYDDGPGGSNLACPTGSSRYCWGHRDVLLTNFGSRSCHGSQ